MCGIAGISSPSPDRRFVTAAGQMAAALSHRGPDSSGVQDLGRCVLASTRLAIVDLSERGNQPMCNEDGTVWIAYNGECYNAAEHRRNLRCTGHSFSSLTDTEVILHLYEEFGDSCVEKLRGMFAFAIWDARTNKLLLARDRLGIKPLYYVTVSGGILFASEIKALLASGQVAHKLDPAGIRAFLQLGHIPPPWTAIRGIKPLPPGHIGIWRERSFDVTPYWQLPCAVNGVATQSPVKIADNLREILLESSRLQLMSDVPIALFLSGGVDSAAVGALTRSAEPRQLTALTIAFQEKAFDESAASRETAELLGIDHQVVPMPASQMIGSLDHAVWSMDQPTMDGLNSYWIARAAANAGFKVALSGQGGDELFGGYESAAWFDRLFHTAQILKPFPQAAGQALFDQQGLPFRWRKLSYVIGAEDSFVAAQLAVRGLFLETDAHRLLNPSFDLESTGSNVKELIAGWARRTALQETRERIAFLDFPLHLESRLLRDGDMMSMTHGLEVRPILLDHKIVEFVLRLPMSCRPPKKRLLLDALRGFMPAPVYTALLNRPKRTFTFPFARWIHGELRSTIADVFQPDRLSAVGLLNPGAVQALWQRYLAHPKDVGWSRLWTIFVLARWCELMRVGV